MIDQPHFSPLILREPAMKNVQKPNINPGNVIFGKRTQSNENGVHYKVIFCCRKSGFDFLGQIQIVPGDAKLKVELFNESFFERFEADRQEVQTALESKVLTALLRRASVPESCRSIVRAFISEKRAQQTDIAVKNIEPEAEKDNLSAIFENLNNQYFNGKLEAVIQWGKDSKTPNRRSFSFGSYDQKKKMIRIHPRLRQEFVPIIVLELTIYHEMCHQFHPPFKSNGQWRSHHESFRQKEREYGLYRDAMAWEKANWIKLLNPAQDAPTQQALAQ